MGFGISVRLPMMHFTRFYPRLLVDGLGRLPFAFGCQLKMVAMLEAEDESPPYLAQSTDDGFVTELSIPQDDNPPMVPEVRPHFGQQFLLYLPFEMAFLPFDRAPA